MLPQDFFELICEALPADIHPGELKALSGPELWAADPREAAARALYRHPRLNWQSYLESHSDVKAAGKDPVLHFLDYGVYEGRRLKSWSRYHVQANPDDPRVSVVVPSYNDGDCLENCVGTLLCQTLPDIEIIIVDDFSLDQSLPIARELAAKDERIVVIPHSTSLGTYAARKTGALAARGNYIMFLNPDDQLVPDACMTAWKAIAKGWDIVSFAAKAASGKESGSARPDPGGRSAKPVQFREYGARQFLDLAFVKRNASWDMGSKICETGLVQDAFRQFGDARITGDGADICGFVALAGFARTICQMDVAIYAHRAQIAGISCGLPVSEDGCSLRGDYLAPLERFCGQTHLDNIFSAIKLNQMRAVTLSIGRIPEQIRPDWFKKAGGDLGLLYSLEYLARTRFQDGALMATLLPPAVRRAIPANEKIGVFCHSLASRERWRAVGNICQALALKGRQAAVFLEEKSKRDHLLPEGVKRYYLAASRNWPGLMGWHLSDLRLAARQAGIGAMLYLEGAQAPLLWDAFLLRLLDIPVIAWLDFDINSQMLRRGAPWSCTDLFATLRRLDKTICVNKSSALCLRNEGVDAIFIPGAVATPDLANDPDPMEFDIIVSGQMDSPLHNMEECLRVLVEVVSHITWARMLFIGDFRDSAAKCRFLAFAEDLGIRRKVELADNIDDPAALFARGKLLFSASSLVGDSGAILEAQAVGLPVVAYDLDIDVAENNESLIMIPQGDRAAAALAISRLLGDKAERRRLSAIACERVRRYSIERLANSLDNVLAGLSGAASDDEFSGQDYRKMIRYLSFYAGHAAQNKFTLA